MHILVSSPYPLNSPKGNTITAKRIVHILETVGHAVERIHTDMPPCADAMISLHATKTLTTSRRFKACCPKGKLIIYLTGTDLYRDLPANNPEFFEALNLADHLVVSQRASLKSIPKDHLPKTCYVPASVLLPEDEPIPAPPTNSIVLAAHLRPVKNPFLINKALKLLPSLNLHAFTLGAALDPKMAQLANTWQNQDERFQWLDNTSYPQAISWMRQVDYTLNSSHSEGGSNAIAESVMLGTPVLASRIEGNIGLLEEDYLGYFEPDSTTSLAKLIDRALNESDFKSTLKSQTRRLQAKFLPNNELQAWLNILNK